MEIRGGAVPAELEAVIGRNITLVYDALDLQAVDRNKVRELVPGVFPTIMDTPEMIVAIYPPDPWFIQIGDRRIRITVPAQTPSLGDYPLWDFAHTCNGLVPAGKSSLIAYGFNFDLIIKFTDRTPQEILTSQFVNDRDKLESILGGSLTSFAPRIVFKTGDIQYDIIFEFFSDIRLKVHANAHFEAKEIQLPVVAELKKLFLAEFEHLGKVVIDLLNA